MTIKLKKPKIPYEGWTIESDIGQKTVDLSNVVLHLDDGQKNGNYITGTELHKKLEGKNPLSAAVLDYLIEHPEETPDAWKEKTAEGLTQFIFFWGTIYRYRSGYLCVRDWYWNEGRWQSNYRWLVRGWDGCRPSALFASTQPSDASAVELDHEVRIKALEDWRAAMKKALEPDVS